MIVTFGPDGAYGHPDHIAVSQFTIAAVAAAASPEFVSNSVLPVHRVSKLYFIAWSAGKWGEYQSALKRLNVRVDGAERHVTPWPDWAITTRVDCTKYWSVVRDPVLAHQTQMAVYGRLGELSEQEHRKLWGSQEFYRVFSLVNGGRQTETDLFEGLFPSHQIEDKIPAHQEEKVLLTRSAPLDMPPAQFRRLGHLLVDQIAGFLASIPSRRVTFPDSPSDVRGILDESAIIRRSDPSLEELLRWISGKLFNHSLHNGHPRFWGYITSSAAPVGILGDLLAASVNCNVGAWKLSPLASEMEADVVRQIAGLLGYPTDCGGLLVSGGNMANFVGFLVARRAQLGPDCRTQGIGAGSSRLRVYVSSETHTWIQKAADMAGLGTDSMRWLETDEEGRVALPALELANQSGPGTGRPSIPCGGICRDGKPRRGGPAAGSLGDLPKIRTVVPCRWSLWRSSRAGSRRPSGSEFPTSCRFHSGRSSQVDVRAPRRIFEPLEQPTAGPARAERRGLPLQCRCEGKVRLEALHRELSNHAGRHPGTAGDRHPTWTSRGP